MVQFSGRNPDRCSDLVYMCEQMFMYMHVHLVCARACVWETERWGGGVRERSGDVFFQEELIYPVKSDIII